MFILRFIHKHFLLAISYREAFYVLVWASFIVGFYIGWLAILCRLNGGI